MRRSRRQGFTLMEIVVAIVILAILAGIISIVVGPGVAKNKTEPGCISNLQQIAMVYNQYMGENDDQFPSTLSLTENPRTASQFKNIYRCPLVHTGHYWDNVQWALGAKGSIAFSNELPNGTPIPYFDYDSDILYRCLDHGYGGYSRGETPGRMRFANAENRGQVLGVRLSGSVSKVPPYSCWEFRYNPWLENVPGLWQNCDRTAY